MLNAASTAPLEQAAAAVLAAKLELARAGTLLARDAPPEAAAVLLAGCRVALREWF